jgi:hypothetical protein
LSTAGKAECAQAAAVRLPAYEIEVQVVSRLVAFLGSEKEVMDQLGVREDGAEAIQQLLASAQDASRLLKAGTRARLPNS